MSSEAYPTENFFATVTVCQIASWDWRLCILTVDSLRNHVCSMGCALPTSHRAPVHSGRQSAFIWQWRLGGECVGGRKASHIRVYYLAGHWYETTGWSRLVDDDLQNELPAPYCTLGDHTLPIRDIAVGVGAFPKCRVLTASLDHSVKVCLLQSSYSSIFN